MKTRWLYAGLGYLTTVIGSYFFFQFIHGTVAPIFYAPNSFILLLIFSPLPNISHFFSISIGYYMGLRKEYQRKMRKRSIGTLLGYLISVFIWAIAATNRGEPMMTFSLFVGGFFPINLPHIILIFTGRFIGKNFETTEELKQYRIATKNMKYRNIKPTKSQESVNKKPKPVYSKNVSSANSVTDHNELTKSALQKRLRKLKAKEESLLVDDIEQELKRDDLASKRKAEKLLTEREHGYQKYQNIYGELEDIRSKIIKLTDRIAEGKLDSDAYKRALNDLESQQRESEETLWQLRSELFKDEYEKPF